MFGIDSEIQDFTRKLLKRVDDQTCFEAMAFSAFCPLATSMKRGEEKTFAIRFGGKNGSYDGTRKTFSGWTHDSMKSLRGMSQEIVDPNHWMCTVASSFTTHKIKDSRNEITELFHLFDPIHMFAEEESKKIGTRRSDRLIEQAQQRSREKFYSSLIRYKEKVSEKKKVVIRLFNQLKKNYNKLSQGESIAFKIVTIAWETGHMMRLMFLRHLQPADFIKDEIDERIEKILFDRFNSIVRQNNPLVLELLNLQTIAQCVFVTEKQLFEIAKYLLKELKTKVNVAKALKTTPYILNKIIAEDFYEKAKFDAIAKELTSREKVENFFCKIDQAHIEQGTKSQNSRNS